MYCYSESAYICLLFQKRWNFWEILLIIWSTEYYIIVSPPGGQIFSFNKGVCYSPKTETSFILNVPYYLHAFILPIYLLTHTFISLIVFKVLSIKNI